MYSFAQPVAQAHWQADDVKTSESLREKVRFFCSRKHGEPTALLKTIVCTGIVEETKTSFWGRSYFGSTQINK